MTQDTRIGTEIAGYRIEAVLGRGGMSVVYLATQDFPKRKVALKLLAPELAEDQGFRERFIRESNAAASLDHPNVIPIYGAGEDRGVMWIAMRYVEGENLAHLMAESGPLSPERTVHIVDQVAQALDAAHRRGLIHRDVKPGNVMLAEGDHAYLTDFGITKRREAGTDFTKTGQFLGSVDYAAPEQIRGEPVDGRADVYSLGCILYECLVGEPPFPREAEVAVLYAHLNEPPPRPTAHRSELPAGIDDVVATALEKRADRRYASAGELARADRDAFRPAVPVETVSSATQRRRSRAAFASAAVALATVVTVVAVAVSGGHPATTPSSPPSSHTGASTGRPGPPPGTPIRVNTVAKLDPRTGRVLADYAVGSSPDSITFSGGRVWVINDSNQTVSVLDPKTGEVAPPIGGIPSPCVLDPALDGGVWVTSCKPSIVTHIDPRSLMPGRHVRIPAAAYVAEFDGSLWIASQLSLGASGFGKDIVDRLDATSLRLQRKITVGSGAADIIPAFGWLWGCDYFDGTLWRIDPSTNTAKSFSGFNQPDNIGVGSNDFWIFDVGGQHVVHYNPFTNQILDTVGNGRARAGRVLVTSGTVWILTSRSLRASTDSGDVRPARPRIGSVGANEGPDLLMKVDQDSSSVSLTYQLPFATAATVGGGAIWVSAGPD
jgi:serine/threonine protein kinase